MSVIFLCSRTRFLKLLYFCRAVIDSIKRLGDWKDTVRTESYITNTSKDAVLEVVLEGSWQAWGQMLLP